MKKIFKIFPTTFITGSLVMIFGSNLVNFINYIYNLIMGRMLGPVEYGELVVLLSIISIFGVIPGTINIVVTKYISSAKKETDVMDLLNYLQKIIFKISILIFILMITFSTYISTFLQINNPGYMIFLAGSFLFSLPALLNRSVLQGLLKFNEMIISLLAEASTKLLAGAFFVYFGFHIFGALTGIISSAAFGWYLTKKYLKKYHTKSKLKLINLRPLFFYTFPVIAQQLAFTSLNSADFMLVKHFFNPFDAGIYASMSTLGKIIFFGLSPIGAVMFPIISQKNSKGLEYKNIFKFSLGLTCLFSMVVVVIYWLYPNLAINLLYGSAYSEAKNLLVWFGIFMSFYTICSLFVGFNLSLGRISVVILPVIAALIQLIAIWFYHQTIFIVITISIIIAALLLLSLLIYSSCQKGQDNGNKVNLNNSASL